MEATRFIFYIFVVVVFYHLTFISTMKVSIELDDGIFDMAERHAFSKWEILLWCTVTYSCSPAKTHSAQLEGNTHPIC